MLIHCSDIKTMLYMAQIVIGGGNQEKTFGPCRVSMETTSMPYVGRKPNKITWEKNKRNVVWSPSSMLLFGRNPPSLHWEISKTSDTRCASRSWRPLLSAKLFSETIFQTFFWMLHFSSTCSEFTFPPNMSCLLLKFSAKYRKSDYKPRYFSPQL